jgi:endonuclease/exonuclease/phosphatase family metal-dependent hydrolase
MVCVRVAFANICQGLKSEGKKNNTDVFSKYWPSAYRDTYLKLNPDIVCFAEVPFDDKHGNSSFLADFAADMKAADYKGDVHEKSWLMEDKYYGTAIITRFPLDSYQTLRLPNPRFEVDNPDGSHWIMHDKNVQSAIVRVGDLAVKLFNLHYFPFHRFKRNMNEPELKPIRTEFIKQLRLEENTPTILTGDFNNGHDHLESAYPELFDRDRLQDAVKFGAEDFIDYYPSDKYQLDHILYSPQNFTLLKSEVIHDNSDHRGIVADLQLVLRAR